LSSGDNRLVGYNTDATGFERAIGSLVKASGHGPVALIGAGGVGKAIAHALAALGIAELSIFDTDRAKAEQIATQLRGRQKMRIAESVADALQRAVGLVNGTPTGMLPDRGTPVPDALLHRSLWVADAVYMPLWTPLLTAAKAKGAEIMTGRDLAVHQAADAFELFTGFVPPIVEMGNAFDAVMAKRYAAPSKA
jgi:shikimate dehydrogenase